MSSQSGLTGIYCLACDRAQTPALLQRQLSGKSEGMLLKCPTCQRVYSYASLMDPKNQRPRMLKSDLPEKQPPGTIIHQVWVYPEVLAALQAKFPQNLATTLCACFTSLADQDTVLIEGEWAREMAALGVKKGKEVLALAKEVKELRDKVRDYQLKEEALQGIFRAMGLAGMPQLANPAAGPTSSTSPAIPTDAAGTPLQPPRAQFAALTENEAGLLVPADGGDGEQSTSPFSFGSGQAPAADARPAFVTRNIR